MIRYSSLSIVISTLSLYSMHHTQESIEALIARVMNPPHPHPASLQNRYFQEATSLMAACITGSLIPIDTYMLKFTDIEQPQISYFESLECVQNTISQLRIEMNRIHHTEFNTMIADIELIKDPEQKMDTFILLFEHFTPQDKYWYQLEYFNDFMEYADLHALEEEQPESLLNQIIDVRAYRNNYLTALDACAIDRGSFDILRSKPLTITPMTITTLIPYMIRYVTQTAASTAD